MFGDQTFRVVFKTMWSVTVGGAYLQLPVALPLAGKLLALSLKIQRCISKRQELLSMPPTVIRFIPEELYRFRLCRYCRALEFNASQYL